jgi:tRNA pseudouridine38-40 synthase
VERVYSDTAEAMIKQHGTQPDEKVRSEDFIRFTIVGQSFIYNQIRKMIGLLIQIYYEELQGEQSIRMAFTKEKFNVYLAPGEGLYLNRMTFNAYNSRKEE